MPAEVLDPRTMLPVAAVVWGPFPLRWPRLLGGLAALALALVIVLVALQRQIVTCARSGELAGQCELQSGIAARVVRRFPLRSLRAVHVVYSETSQKGHTTHWGQLVLRVDDRELGLARQAAHAADQDAAALQQFLHDAAQPEVRIDSGWSVLGLAIGGGFALAGAALLYSVWSGRRRFRLTWDASMKQLTLQPESPLGAVAGAASTWTLYEPVAVAIQWEEVTDFFTSARSPGPRGGRLRVRLAGGGGVDLLPRPRPGYRVHLRAAAELTQLLRCPPLTAAEAARSAESDEAQRPRIGPGWTGISGRIAATWIGVCCGSLLGIAVGAVLALLLGFAKTSDSAGGPPFFVGVIGGAAAGVALAWRVFLRPDER